MSESKGGRGPAAALRAVGFLGILLIVLLYLPLTVPKLFGLQSFAITSGSMEPEIPTGSLVFAGQTDPAALRPGDVIVFYAALDSQGTVTHRVLENDAAGRQVVTKGDANAEQDLRPVPYGNIIGTVKAKLPLLGWAAMFLETLRGKIVSLAVLAAAAVLYLLGGSLRRKESTDAAVEEKQ